MWLFIENQKGNAFLYFVVCGFVIGAFYDIFRVSRAIYSGGKIKLFFEDLLFCIFTAVAFIVFSFNACMGIVRMFAALGTLFGFFAFRFTVGIFTVSIAKGLKALILPHVVSFVAFLKLRYIRIVLRLHTSRKIHGIKHAVNAAF